MDRLGEIKDKVIELLGKTVDAKDRVCYVHEAGVRKGKEEVYDGVIKMVNDLKNFVDEVINEKYYK